MSNYIISLFVPFEESLIFKELGFDEECFGVYVNGKFKPRYKSKNSSFKPNQKLDSSKMEYCTAITYDQAFKWIRNRYDVDITINSSKVKNSYFSVIIVEGNTDDFFMYDIDTARGFEDVRLSGLIEILKIIKEKEK